MPQEPTNPKSIADSLTELAARCEAATGPDRELDGSIWWWAALTQEQRDGFGDFVSQCIERDGSAGKALAQFYDSSNPSCLAKIAFQRAYTASLDAAMTLVPEGWYTFLAGEDRHSKRWLWHLRGGFGFNAKCRAAIPALALTAAALRAHILKESQS